mgnify:CR=1 FL=1
MGNIPTNITREHILAVIHELEHGLDSVPPREHSTKYCLLYNGKHYPPKYVVRRANVRANGEELWSHYGGPETNDFLRTRRFDTIECPHGGTRFD